MKQYERISERHWEMRLLSRLYLESDGEDYEAGMCGCYRQFVITP